MKYTILSIAAIMLGITANSQVITVKIHTVQNFNHSSALSTVQARQLDLIEYPSHIVGENVYTFDFEKKLVTLTNSNGIFYSFNMIEVNRNENIIDCIIYDGVGNCLFLLDENENNEREFLMEYIEGDKVFGQFSLNSDFSYTIE